MSESPISVGGGYVENEDHVPNPTDIVAQYNTSGTGAHGDIKAVSPIFQVDKVKTAQEIKAALDPEDSSVPESRVLLPETHTDNETALERLHDFADRVLHRGVEIGGPAPAEEAAGLEGSEGDAAAVEQERKNAAANSTGQRSAGDHEGGFAGNADGGTDDQSHAVGDSAVVGAPAEGPGGVVGENPTPADATAPGENPTDGDHTPSVDEGHPVV